MQCRLYLQHYLTTKVTVIRVFITYNTNNTGNTTHTSSNYKIASMGRKTDRERKKKRKSKTERMNTARMVLIVLTVI